MTTLVFLTPSPATAALLPFAPDDALLITYDTCSAPADHLRYVRDVAARAGRTLSEYCDGRTIWDVFADEQRFVHEQTGEPVCAAALKTQPILRLAAASAPCEVWLPYTSADAPVAQKLYARLRMLQGVTARFPLIEQRISATDARERALRMTGVALPAMYAWAGAATCSPCIRGTLAYWGMILERDHELVNRMIEMEEAIDKMLFDRPLRDLLPEMMHARWQYDHASVKPALFTLPCACR